MNSYYQVIVDGEPWVAGDGSDAWTIDAAHDMAAECERKGYTNVEVVPL